MRILAVADTTFNWPSTLPDFARFADVVVSLGDLYAADVGKLVSLGTPVIGVYGNHCRRGYLPKLGALDLSHGGPVGWSDLGGVTVLGVSGCVRYNGNTDHQWTQEEYAAALRDMPPSDWVITHCPPRGCNDDPQDPAHVGIDALAEYVQKYRPKRLFHGHTYPTEPITAVGGTAVHYVFGWRMLRTPGTES